MSPKNLKGAVAAGTLLLLSACAMEPGRYTGGGTINSLGGEGRAQISFTADGCDPDNVKGNLTLIDKTAIEYQDIGGVSLKADITQAGLCTAELAVAGEPGENTVCGSSDVGMCNAGQVGIEIQYTSTNGAAPGSGLGIVCSQSAGAGGGGGIHALIAPIRLETGPYAGYMNAGTLKGNAMFHQCNAPKSEG